MLSDKNRARAAAHVKNFTDVYIHAKRDVGYNVRSFALPTFDSQDDFDGCRPEEKRKAEKLPEAAVRQDKSRQLSLAAQKLPGFARLDEA